MEQILRRLQYLAIFGRLCLMGTNIFSKKIFLNRLFTYTLSSKHKQYRLIPDAIELFYKFWNRKPGGIRWYTIWKSSYQLSCVVSLTDVIFICSSRPGLTCNNYSSNSIFIFFRGRRLRISIECLVSMSFTPNIIAFIIYIIITFFFSYFIFFSLVNMYLFLSTHIYWHNWALDCVFFISLLYS